MAYENYNTNKGSYKHLNFAERVRIEVLLNEGYSKAYIAKKLGRHKTTISNEIERGTTTQIKLGKAVEVYLADTGQIIYETSRTLCIKPYKALVCSDYIDFVVDKFTNENWSLDACYGYAVRNKLFEHIVCTKTLYNYVDMGMIPISPTDLPQKLSRNTKTARVKKNKKTLGESIENRPDISNREEFGHWEIDTVVGLKKKDEPVLLTLVERKTRFVIILKIESKTSEAVRKAFDNLFAEYGDRFSEVFKTITSDNGSEFSSLDDIVKHLSTMIYFTHPYSSYERGSNERHNGLIRRFIPKGTSIRNFAKHQVQLIADWINELPRKILGYFTPNELYDLELDEIYTL